jgi:hypothetical protein
MGGGGDVVAMGDYRHASGAARRHVTSSHLGFRPSGLSTPLSSTYVPVTICTA